MDLARIHPGRKLGSRRSAREWALVALRVMLIVAGLAVVFGAYIAVCWLVRAAAALAFPSAATVPLEVFLCAPMGLAFLAVAIFRPRFSRSSRKPFTLGQRAYALVFGLYMTINAVVTFFQAKH